MGRKTLANQNQAFAHTDEGVPLHPVHDDPRLGKSLGFLGSSETRHVTNHRPCPSIGRRARSVKVFRLMTSDSVDRQDR